MKNNFISILLISLVIIWGINCKQEDTTPNTDNYNPAQHNHLIKSSRIFGNGGEETVFKCMINSADGNAYYIMYNKNNATSFDVVVGSNGIPVSSSSTSNTANYEIGKIQFDGTKIWNKYTGFSARRINTLPFNSGKLKDAIAAVGHNSNSGFIAVYAEDGQKICEKAVSQINKSVWFNSVKVMRYDANYTYLTALGGLNDTLNHITYPYLANFRLNNSALTLTIESENWFTMLPQEHFVNFELTNEVGTPIIATTNNEDDSKIGAFKISSNNIIIWQQHFNEPNGAIYINMYNKIICDNQRIYLNGVTDDNTKAVSSLGNKWKSGLVMCLDNNGNVQWRQKVSLTKEEEYGNNLLKYGNYLLLTGTHSSYCSLNNDKKCEYSRSNGLISKIDMLSGNIVANYTFGEKNSASGLYNSVIINNAKLLLGGYTNFDSSKGIYQGWLIGVNLSDL
ncbi:MAG: hypothetical protein RLZZ628_3065 [Bacteroidota bacterium]|jgi:hypothetical protein